MGVGGPGWERGLRVCLFKSINDIVRTSLFSFYIETVSLGLIYVFAYLLIQHIVIK